MRVLHLVKTSTGASWALRQMRELVRLGLDVHVAMPPGGLAGRYATAGVNVHEFQPDLPVKRPWQMARHLAAFRELVVRVGPDVIHSHFVGTTLTMRLALGRDHALPRLFQVPGPLHLEHALFREVEFRTAGPADYWIGACKWTRDAYVRRGAPASRVFLSHYWQEPEEFQPRSTGTLRRELGWGPDTEIVGMVAYLYAPKRYLGQRRGLKGHEDLIDALVLLRRKRPRVRAVFVGGAWGEAQWYEKRVRRYAAERLGEHAVFLGTRQDVADLYSDLDVAVHPSHSENLGGAAESLMLGVPTIATEVGGFPDIVVPGETGWLVPPHDPRRLAECLDAVLSDPRGSRRVASAGPGKVARILDPRTNASAIISAYESAQIDREQARRGRAAP